jgi:hypothetical protein
MSGAGKGPAPKTSRLMMRCIQVVPAFIEVEMTTSPGRTVTASHRSLSRWWLRYVRVRRGVSMPLPFYACDTAMSMC